MLVTRSLGPRCLDNLSGVPFGIVCDRELDRGVATRPPEWIRLRTVAAQPLRRGASTGSTRMSDHVFQEPSWQRPA